MKNEYFLKGNIRIDYTPLVLEKASPLLAELVRELATMRLYLTGLGELRQKWWKPVALVLMVPNVEATQEEVDEMRSKAPEAFTKVIPDWCMDLCGGLKGRDILESVVVVFRVIGSRMVDILA